MAIALYAHRTSCASQSKRPKVIVMFYTEGTRHPSNPRTPCLQCFYSRVAWSRRSRILRVPPPLRCQPVILACPVSSSLTVPSFSRSRQRMHATAACMWSAWARGVVQPAVRGRSAVWSPCPPRHPRTCCPRRAHLCTGLPMSLTLRSPAGGGWVATTSLIIREHRYKFSFDGATPCVSALLPTICGEHVVPKAELAACAALHDRGASQTRLSPGLCPACAFAHASAPPSCSGLPDGNAQWTRCRQQTPAGSPHGPLGDDTCLCACQASRASCWSQQRCVVGLWSKTSYDTTSHPTPPFARSCCNCSSRINQSLCNHMPR